MKYCLLFCLLFFQIGLSWGQIVPPPSTPPTKSENRLVTPEYWEWGGKAGFGPQGYEVGISRCNWRGVPFGMATVSVLNEFPRGITWVNPKISAEIAVLFLAARLSAVDYTDWKRHDVRFRPEYGFSFLGFANVMYHRDITLSADRFNIETQGWSLTVNLPSNPKNYTLF